MEKQWALVTGASSGIGFAYAKELASRGYPIVMVSNEEQAIQEKGEWIRKTYGVDVLALYQDLAVPGAAKALFDICQEEEIIVDILVNNAGMFFLNEIVDEKEVKVEKMLYLHMTTPTQLCYYFGKEMKRREHGHILIMSSLSCWFPLPRHLSLCLHEALPEKHGARTAHRDEGIRGKRHRGLSRCGCDQPL